MWFHLNDHNTMEFDPQNEKFNYFRSVKRIIGAFFRLQIRSSRYKDRGWVLIEHAAQLTPEKNKQTENRRWITLASSSCQK